MEYLRLVRGEGISGLTQVKKRDGRISVFDQSKIIEAIWKAVVAVGGSDRAEARRLSDEVIKVLDERYSGKALPYVEEIQDIVENVLIEQGHAKTAKAYILYRRERTEIREAKSTLLDAVAEIEQETNRENANIGRSPSAKMLQIATAASRAFYLNRVIPQDFSEAHRRGAIHIHDLDFYAKTANCLQIGLGDLLKTGFNTGHGYIRPPKRIASAAAQAAIILQSNQNDMYGGQSFPHFDRDLADFLQDNPAEYEEIFQAMEGLVYNLNSMHSRAGAQVPFSSINFGADTREEARMISRALLEAYDKGLGHGEQPIFPNLIFRLKKGVNMHPEDPSYDLYQLAVKVASRRMFPAFSFMDSSFNSQYGVETSYMGCRTRVISNRHGPEVAARRGNIAFTTINLPRIALQYNKWDDFVKSLEEMLELCSRQLVHRYQLLSKLKVKDLPFLMGQGLYMGSENMSLIDDVESCFKQGSLTIGFVGLAETLKHVIGQHHGESDEAQRAGLELISFMRDKCDEFADREDLNFSLVATPAEQVAGRALKMDRDIFGVVPGITDREYYTNSFHVPVDYPISLFRKIELEGPYHKYTNGGHISYVELDSMPEHNPLAISKIFNYMAENDMGYGAVNFPIDECKCCHFRGVID